jgi:hypothetical protein
MKRNKRKHLGLALPVVGKPYFVIAGIKVPVIGVVLRNGEINLIGSVTGPVPDSDGSSVVTLFGDDDRGIAQFPDTNDEWRRINGTFTFMQPVRVIAVE